MTKKLIKDYMLITFGIILVALSVEYFFAPNKLAAGGVTGIAIVLNNLVPNLSVGVITLVLNLALFAAAFMLIGGNFGAKTIFASLGLSVVMWGIEKFFNPFAITTDLVIATAFGTIISAFGMAIVFNCNASTGGTDILAKILNKFFHINIGKSLLIVDIIITFAAAMVFGLDIGFYAMLSVIILGITIDRFIDGFNSSKEIVIISDRYEEISKFILEDLDRGCTYLKGVGVYSEKDIKVIYTVIGRSEFIKLKEFIKGIDKRAFITVRESYEVLGEGFMEIE
ncbi:MULTISPECIES: YitT family protein [Clostridium]|uniref:YitT family protein n=1 Tax=Clostridium cibarium TaxID=2762247 RepID=A0ABR8PSG8_9CLOT|nr:MULTISPECIES: YitT family protein [Clostridium]MBD7911116.1 YitT family protein [Clostridium cibarium]